MNFPPAIEGTSWLDAWTQLRARALRLTCADATRVVAAWTFAVGETAWPSWYQFGALAYGWTPETDELRATQAQAARVFPMPDELWESMREAAVRLDATAPAGTSWVQFDNTPGAWGDDTWLSLLRMALAQDGARPSVVAVELETAVRDSDSPEAGQWLPLALALGVLWLMDNPRRRRLR